MSSEWETVPLDSLRAKPVAPTADTLAGDYTGLQYNEAERRLAGDLRAQTPPNFWGEGYKSVGRGGVHGALSLPTLAVEGGEWLTGLGDGEFDYDDTVNNWRRRLTGESLDRGDWEQFSPEQRAALIGLEYGTELLAPFGMIGKAAKGAAYLAKGGKNAPDALAERMLKGADEGAEVQWNGLSAKIREGIAQGDFEAVRTAAAAKGDLASAAAGGGAKGQAARQRMIAEGEKIIVESKTRGLRPAARTARTAGKAAAATALPGTAALMGGRTIEEQENAGRLGQAAYAAPSALYAVGKGVQYLAGPKGRAGANKAGQWVKDKWGRVDALAEAGAKPGQDSLKRVDDFLDLFFDGQTYRLPHGVDVNEVRPLLQLSEDPRLIGRLKEGAKKMTISGRRVLDATNIPEENWMGALGSVVRHRDQIMDAGGEPAKRMISRALARMRVPAAQTLDDIPSGTGPAIERAKAGAVESALRNPDGTSGKSAAAHRAYNTGQGVVGRANSRPHSQSILGEAGRSARANQLAKQADVEKAYVEAGDFARERGLVFNSPINEANLEEFLAFEKMFGGHIPPIAKRWMKESKTPPSTMDSDFLSTYYQRLTSLGRTGDANMARFVSSQKKAIEEAIRNPAVGTAEDGAEYLKKFQAAGQKFKRMRADHQDFDSAAASRAAHTGGGMPQRILRKDGTIDYAAAASILRGTSESGRKYGDSLIPEKAGVNVLARLARSEVYEGIDGAANPMSFAYRAFQGIETGFEKAASAAGVARSKAAKEAGAAGVADHAESLPGALAESHRNINTVIRRQVVDSIFQKLYAGDSDRFLEQMLRNKKYAEFVRDRMGEIDGGTELLKGRLAARMATGHNSDAAQWNAARVILGPRTEEIREWAGHRGKDVRQSLSNLYSNSFSAATDRPSFSLRNYDTLRKQFGDDVAEGMALRRFWEMFGGQGGIDGGESLRRAEGVLAGVRSSGSAQGRALADRLEGRMEALALGAIGSGERNLDDLFSFLKNARGADDGGRAEALVNRIGKYADNKDGTRGAAAAMVQRRIFERMFDAGEEAGGLQKHVGEYRDTYERMMGGGKKGEARFRDLYLISMLTGGVNRIRRASEPSAQQTKAFINELAGELGVTVGTVASRLYLAASPMMSNAYMFGGVFAKTIDTISDRKIIGAYRGEVLRSMGRDAAMEGGFAKAMLKEMGDYFATGDLPAFDKWLAREVKARPYIRSGLGNLAGQGDLRSPQGTNPEDDATRAKMGEVAPHYEHLYRQQPGVNEVRGGLQ